MKKTLPWLLWLWISAVIVGAVLSLTGIGMKQYWPGILAGFPTLGLPAAFPLNGIQVAFLSAGVASTGYVLVSLVAGREAFNLDKLAP